MSIFTKPLFNVQTKSPVMKTPRLCIEGKWRFISKMIDGLLKDGWKQISIEANKEFTFTIVELER